jgi:hypothetical protein
VDPNETVRKVSQAQSDLVDLKAALRQLADRIERQGLVIGVLKDMLLSGIGSNEEQFLDRLAQAAAQKANEKVCAKCGKALNPKQRKCMYCGEPRPPELV